MVVDNDMIEGQHCASKCRVVNAWYRFWFYVFFFLSIAALDSVWFLDNLLLSDYLGCRGRSRILPVSDFILFYFLSLQNFFLSFSFLLMLNWAESLFALFDFLIKIALIDFNFCVIILFVVSSPVSFQLTTSEPCHLSTSTTDYLLSIAFMNRIFFAVFWLTVELLYELNWNPNKTKWIKTKQSSYETKQNMAKQIKTERNKA